MGADRSRILLLRYYVGQYTVRVYEIFVLLLLDIGVVGLPCDMAVQKLIFGSLALSYSCHNFSAILIILILLHINFILISD